MGGRTRAALLLVGYTVLGHLSAVKAPEGAEGFGLYPFGLLCLVLVQVHGRDQKVFAWIAFVVSLVNLWWVGLSPVASVLYGAAAVGSAILALNVLRGRARGLLMHTESDLLRVVTASVIGGGACSAAAALAGVVDRSDQVGAVVAAAFVNGTASLLLWLPLAMRRRVSPSLAGNGERALQWTLLCLASVVVLSAEDQPTFPYVVLLVLVWAGLRLSLVETLVQLIVVRLVATTYVAHGIGPFAETATPRDLPPDLDVLHVQAFLIACSVGVIALSLSSSRARAQSRLEAIARADQEAERRLSTVFEALEAERTALEELREVDKVKDAFVSTVSHELRTPITNIIGYSELLDEGDFGELTAPQKEALVRIEDNSKRLLSLINDLLTLSHLRSGTLEVNLVPVDMVEVVRAAEDAILPRLRGSGVSMVIDLPPEPLVVQGEAEKLERVLVNLMSNAVKFTPSGGRVSVRLVGEGSWAIAEVADTGYGIPPEDLDRLFSQFFRSSVAQRKHIQGTGLGLSIVRSIVEAHGGQVEVASTLDVGTTFRVYLPR